MRACCEIDRWYPCGGVDIVNIVGLFVIAQCTEPLHADFNPNPPLSDYGLDHVYLS